MWRRCCLFGPTARYYRNIYPITCGNKRYQSLLPNTLNTRHKIAWSCLLFTRFTSSRDNQSFVCQGSCPCAAERKPNEFETVSNLKLTAGHLRRYGNRLPRSWRKRHAVLGGQLAPGEIAARLSSSTSTFSRLEGTENNHR
jgi:hypothetical protein